VKPDDPSIRAPSPKPAVRALDGETITLLIKQGEQLAEAGDLAAARTMFQRAAEADDAAAAIALGATYDPTVLARMGAVGIDGDVMKARFWYQRAVSLGSTEA
jgi:TPR repeat protein